MKHQQPSKLKDALPSLTQNKQMSKTLVNFNKIKIKSPPPRSKLSSHRTSFSKDDDIPNTQRSPNQFMRIDSKNDITPKFNDLKALIMNKNKSDTNIFRQAKKTNSQIFNKTCIDIQDEQTFQDRVNRELEPDKLMKYNKDVEEQERLEIKMREINEIKKLHFWDQEHLENKKENQKLLETVRRVSNNQSLVIRKEMESINSLNVIKKSLSKLNFKSLNKQFEEFAKKSDKEQGTILMHNISLTKKKFNFDVFGRRDQHDIKSNLQVDIKEIKEDNLDSDYYREIIKEKQKIELQYRKELMEIAQKIFEKKIDKQKLEEINSELYNESIAIKNEYENKKEYYQGSFSNLEKQYNFNIATINMNTLNESGTTNRSRISNRKQTIVDQEERMRFISDYQKNCLGLEQQIYDLNANYEKVKGRFDKLVEENKMHISIVEKEIKYLKSTYNNLTKDLRIYYTDILKKGFDVRKEGLVWVVKRLIELDMHIEYSLFPKFLDHVQIDYLLKLANLQIESSQLKIILKSLKIRQKGKREQENNEFLMRATNLSEKSKAMTSRSNFFALNGTEENTHTVFSSKTLNYFEKIYLKYEKLLKNVQEQKIEEFQIKAIVSTLKDKLLEYATNENAFDEIDHSENYIIKYFLEHEKQREYFEEILLLRTRIKAIDEQIQNLIKEEQKGFKKRYDQYKNTNAKNSMQYDLLYSALFGNSLSI